MVGFLGLSTEGILVENHSNVLAAEYMMGAIERQYSAQLLLLFGFQPFGLTPTFSGELPMNYRTRVKVGDTCFLKKFAPYSR
jgi:hypothetical protein